MAHYYQTEGHETYCEVCGELRLCDVLAADYREPETGYLDELALCPPVPAGTGGAPMRIHFKNRTGYDRWADIEEVTMLVRLDGGGSHQRARHLLQRMLALARTERIRRSNL